VAFDGSHQRRRDRCRRRSAQRTRRLHPNREIKIAERFDCRLNGFGRCILGSAFLRGVCERQGRLASCRATGEGNDNRDNDGATF
jgi:hypothetical protein